MTPEETEAKHARREKRQAYFAAKTPEEMEAIRVKRRAQAARWNKANPERRRALRAAWARAHRDDERARLAEWRAANIDKVRAQRRAWKLANPERVKADNRAYFQRRYARLRDEIARTLKPLMKVDMYRAASKAVSERLPPFIRDDVISAIVLDVLEGNITVDGIAKAAPEYLRRYWRFYDQFKNISLSSVGNGSDDRTLGEKLGVY